MDRNKIHIDELVRQRLSGGEEEPRPGAWLSMRELLDKQMPVRRPLGGMAWGRSARWTTGLVLLTLVAGGYGSLELRRQGASLNTVERAEVAANTESFKASNKKVIAAATPNGGGHQSRNNSNRANQNTTAALSSTQTPETNSDGAPSPDVAAINKNIGRISTTGARGAAVQSESSETTNTIGALNSGARKADRDSERSIAARSNQRSVRSSRAEAASLNSTADATSTGAQKLNAASTSTDPASAGATRSARNEAREKARSSRQASTSNRQSAANQNGQQPSLASRSEASRANAATRAPNGTEGTRNVAPKVDSTARVRVQRDTVWTTRIAHRYLPTPGVRNGRYVTDTIAYEPVVIERVLPVDEMAMAVAARPAKVRRKPFGRPRKANGAGTAMDVAAKAPVKTNPVQTAPASAAAAVNSASTSPVAAASETLVPLSNYRVSSSRSTALQYSAHEQLQDVIRRAKFSFAQMKFYTGVIGGLNASVSGASLGGFQIGLFGLLSINEKWSIGTEGKFVQRFNRGTELHDPYFQLSTSAPEMFYNNGQMYNVYRVTRDSFKHYYKLSTMESIELPIYLRYTRGRFHGFAGANLSYGLSVKNIEGVEGFEMRTSHRLDTVLASTIYTPPTSTAAAVSIDNFGPRFGVGYTAGFGYQATPSVLVDVRMTQLVWDNRSNTPGGLRVSQTFYRLPSLQLSLGYRFSQRGARR